jgi:subtilisin family serine protease
VVRELQAIGGDAVWLADGYDAPQRLRESIGKEYFVSANVPLLASDKLGVLQSDDFLGVEQREQPDPFPKRYEESGIAAASRKARGRGVICGILDSGIDADHADFKHRNANNGLAVRFCFVLSDSKIQAPAEGRGFDLFGHGTHVASIIGGQLGVAPHAGLIVAGTPRTRLTSSIVMLHTGLNWLCEQLGGEADWGYPLILNLSIGFPERGATDAPSDSLYGEAFATFHAILDALIDGDVLVVSAIGNVAGRHVSPGSRPDVLSVGAVDINHKRSPWSGHVPEPLRPKLTGPRVMGYGTKVVAAERRLANGSHLWVSRSGTSQAAAYVSGVAALYWSETPKMPALDIIRLIEDKSIPLDDDPVRSGKGLACYAPRSGVGAK